MSLTRKLLKELELNDSAIERIIAAHVDTVDSLRAERDGALSRLTQAESALTDQEALRLCAEENAAAAASAREELDAYRIQVHQERHQAARRAALSEALVKQGANKQALPLLLDTVQLTEEDWSGDDLRDAAAALQPVRAKYAALFAAPRALPVQAVQPPIAGGGILTPADVKRMSAADINRHWSAVRTALETN